MFQTLSIHLDLGRMTFGYDGYGPHGRDTDTARARLDRFADEGSKRLETPVAYGDGS